MTSHTALLQGVESVCLFGDFGLYGRKFVETVEPFRLSVRGWILLRVMSSMIQKESKNETCRLCFRWQDD